MLVKHPKLEDWKDSKHLDELIKKILKHTIPGGKPQFRGSALPFCPLYDLVNIDKQEDHAYDAHFYFSVGTALHELIQRFSSASLGNSLIGNFKCNRVLSDVKTGTDHTIKRCSFQLNMTTPNQFKKDLKCPHGIKECKKSPQFEYVEVDVIYKGLSGHIDLIFKIDGKYYLIDIKTTSNYIFTERGMNSGYYPNGKYWHQVETYCYIVEKLYNIKIHQYGILYVGREKPLKRRNYTHVWFVKPFTDRARKQRGKILDTQTKNFSRMKKYLKGKISLSEIYKNRPCKSEKEHNALMAKKFFEGSCPYWKDKSCPSKKILRSIKELHE